MNRLTLLVVGVWGMAFLLSLGLFGVLTAKGEILSRGIANPLLIAGEQVSSEAELPSAESDFSPPNIAVSHERLSALPKAATALLSSPEQLAMRTSRAQPSSPPSTEGPIIIGHSVAGRPLEVYRFGSGPTERMIVAGIHGGYEWNTIALADELITHLSQHPELVPPDKTLYLLRALNPDGEARAHGVEGRANENGVDLNRNWPVNWQYDWPRAGCWVYRSITAGWRPASEAETAALMDFLLHHRIDALISYHSAVLGIFPGGRPPDAASVSLAKAVARVSNYPYPPIDTGCEMTGMFADWASANGIAAIDLELTDHQHTDFEQNLTILSVFLNWKR